MKDVTVALELTVDWRMNDEDVQRLVEWIMESAIDSRNFEGIEHPADVRAITDGVFSDSTPPEWRVRPYRK